ncbi:porin family protein [Chachezhania sediminis]|uniref:porin family protein n=1 Tax=Chachezhania sediminis TaxID=2599291 RepID=UPI001E5FA339|nr:porin family protein [Chachezhania sediminis]
MRTPVSTLSVLFLSTGLAAPALAQSDWNYAVSFYAFAPETTTTIRSRTAKLSFSDALENLDFAYMGYASASNGTWSFFGDYVYTDLQYTAAVGARGGLKAVNKTQYLSGYAAYRIYRAPRAYVDLAGGFRWFKTDTSLQPQFDGQSVGRKLEAVDDWIDPVVGLRAHVNLTEKWSMMALADYGGFTSDSTTWQVTANVGYAFNDNWMAWLGYREVSFDHTLNGQPFKYEQSGPLFGVTYKF